MMMGESACPLPELTPENGLIFRITHRENLPWILRNGLHSRNSASQDPDFRAIGNQDLIRRRHGQEVRVAPYGTLGDYIPFYFTPCTPMLLNILTGWGDVTQVRAENIVVLIARLPVLLNAGIGCVTTDRHALLQTAKFYSGGAGLEHIDWPRLRIRDYRRDPSDPEKVERYQAEALVHGSMPARLLAGIACASAGVRGELEDRVREASLDVEVSIQSIWYRR